MPAPPAYCRLTVLAPGTRADVAVPADVPAAELVPMLMELLGRHGDPARPEPWRLTGATGGVLPPDATLDELGVVDGELLRLAPMAPPRGRSGNRRGLQEVSPLAADVLAARSGPRRPRAC